MIEINLLPEELKAKLKARPKKEPQAKAPGVPQKKQLIIIAVVALGLLFTLNLALLVLGSVKKVKIAQLNNKWDALEPQRKAVEEFSSQYSDLSDSAQAVKQLLAKRILWSEKLNKLSLYLPGGVWFNDISISGSNMTIAGSVVSLQKEEVALVNRLIDSLKNDQVFFRDFSSLQLLSMQRKVLGGYDIADFTLQGQLRNR